eukprot:TRINITY_DN2447_c0_g1_i1.p1 TRINITY_DN2447_c0_g1~~TRINITY_DN2447_c0_g1_i1.p1  ORF type:complete len:334 (-),score=84.66 TRINITY_DN2447_c0_g1_i1:162-1085(-)
MPNVILATSGYDHTIKFWEAPSGICYRTIPLNPDSQVNKLHITPSKEFVAAAGNPYIRFFEANTNNPSPIMSFDGHSGNVTGIGFQEDGKWMYSCSEDSSIKIWDLRAPGCQREFKCDAAVNSVLLHPNQGEILCGLQNGAVQVWDMTSGTKSKEEVPFGEVAVRSVTMARDATTVVAANNKGMCAVYELEKSDTSVMSEAQRIEAHKSYILKCLISPSSNVMATTSADQTIKIWARDKGKSTFSHTKTLTGHQRWVWDCVFSADSAYLVSASSDHSARLWDITQGDSIRHYTGHHKAVTCLALQDT